MPRSPMINRRRWARCGQLRGSFANIGCWRSLPAQYGRSQGLNAGYVAYSLPIASDDTRGSLRYDKNGVVVITPELNRLNVTSSFSSVGVPPHLPGPRTDLYARREL